MRQQKTGIFLKLKSVDSVEMSHLMDILTVSACVHVCAGVCTHVLYILPGNSTTELHSQLKLD